LPIPLTPTRGLLAWQGSMLKRTQLFAAHQQLGARLVEFGGWEMPVEYSGIIQEHRAVRRAAGIPGEASRRGPGTRRDLAASCQAALPVAPGKVARSIAV
jgi:glycine cleavage system aminomethyltransferase T